MGGREPLLDPRLQRFDRGERVCNVLQLGAQGTPIHGADEPERFEAGARALVERPPGLPLDRLLP